MTRVMPVNGHSYNRSINLSTIHAMNGPSSRLPLVILYMRPSTLSVVLDGADVSVGAKNFPNMAFVHVPRQPVHKYLAFWCVWGRVASFWAL